MLIGARKTLLFAAGALSGAVLLRDNFTDTSGVAIASHTMDVGSGWTLHAGTGEIQSNQLDVLTITLLDGTAQFFISADAGAGQSNVIATCTVNHNGSNGQHGLVIRGSDASNHWCALLGIDSLILFQMEAGGRTNRASIATALGTGDTLYLRGEGSILTARHNGNEVTFESAFNETSTRCGLWTEDVAALYDTFLVVAG